MSNKKFSSDFIRLLENINDVRKRLIWLPLSADDTEEFLFEEICNYIQSYQNALNSTSDTNKE